MSSVREKLLAMTPDERAAVSERVAAALGPLRLRYAPIVPTPKQEAFLRLRTREAFYGGAAGPGKSTALLAAALAYVDVPGYSAILFRRTFAELRLPGALIEKALGWLGGVRGVRWNQGRHEFTFPSGATLTFAYLASDAHLSRYQSAEFHFIGFDELTTFTERQYLYMFSRLRRSRVVRGAAPDGTTLQDIPLRIRSASNPGGVGHDWVRDRFVSPRTRAPGAVFIPARITENPYLDRTDYEASLAHLTPTDRARLLRGDWDVRIGGTSFKRDDFVLVDAEDVPSMPRSRMVRRWDLAATAETTQSRDPDWSSGVLLGRSMAGDFYVIDVRRGRWNPGELERQMARVASEDGRRMPIRIPQDPGNAGKHLVDHFKRTVLPGYIVTADKETGDKAERAYPWAAAVANHLVRVVRAPWTRAYLDEHELFGGPDATHDDQVDASSGAHAYIANRSGVLRTRRADGAARIRAR